MKYLRKFDNHAAYEAAQSGLILPNVSLCVNENEVHYKPMPPHDYSQDYLTFTATESGTFKLSGNSISYSLDNGTTWTSLASDTNSPTVNAGDKILWKATLTPTNNGIGKFSSSGNFTVEGNPMSLLFGDNFVGQTSLSGKYYAFTQLFGGCTDVTSAENLSLPATTLAEYCYDHMFSDCTSLTTAPQLPATTLANNCYGSMFWNCTSLTTAPELPATTLANNCYSYMFWNCTNLTTAPQLPATALPRQCYRGMFYGCTNLTTAPSSIGNSSTTMGTYACAYMFQECTSLTTAPELPATTLTLGTYCYYQMFIDCRSLTVAPELPATTLAMHCYENMFRGCTSLTTAPSVLPAITLTDSCYSAMFNYCSGLTTVPELSATTLASSCYSFMFQGCTSLNSITCLATDISANNCTKNWVDSVAASGTFTKAASMSSWTSGINGIPSGWSVQDAS